MQSVILFYQAKLLLHWNGKLGFWKLGPVLWRLKNVPLPQRKMLVLSYTSLLEYILYEKSFFKKNKLLSFSKLPVTLYVPALIYLEGLFESRAAEAPIQYSQRSPSLGTSALVPFRRQSFFNRVNQSLEKDSLIIKSALRVQRPHSTSNVQARSSTNLLNLLKDKSIAVSIWSKLDLAIRIKQFVYVMWEYTLLWSLSQRFLLQQKLWLCRIIAMHK